MPYTDFIRAKTLCQGGDFCDFLFVRHETDIGTAGSGQKAYKEKKTMGLLKRFFNQTRKPEGVLGALMLRGMNSGHGELADWGFTHLPAMSVAQAVDLGCGGGRNAGELIRKYPQAKVTAVDYSEMSVAKAAVYNKEMIAAGRCTVQQGDVSKLQLPPESFDLATAFETVYFWPGLETCFSQVAKVLKPGGMFLICNESDGLDAAGRKFEKIIDGMKCYTAEELEAALRKAGFSDVRWDHHGKKPWICVLARK